MDKIKFMDLSRQHSRIRGEIGDAFGAVCDNTAFIGGYHVEKFEDDFSKYVGAKYAAGVSNGTDALTLVCLAAGIGPGDEVIVPASTFIASAWGPMHAGAKVVFADCTKDSWGIDPHSVEQKITSNTKAIMGVHLYGQPFDLAQISDIVEDNNLILIEDCAQAHGATYRGKKVGNFGIASGFSFYPGKNLGAYGDAGAIVTENHDIDQKIRAYRNQGSWKKYEHDLIGFNMRLDAIQAAVLSVKLKYLDEWTARRREIAKKYISCIDNDKVTPQERVKNADSVYHLFVVCVEDRESFISYMERNGVECGIHYPIPCHLQKVFGGRFKAGDFPNSEYLSKHCVSLPMFPELTEGEVAKVIELCNGFDGKNE